MVAMLGESIATTFFKNYHKNKGINKIFFVFLHPKNNHTF